MSAGSSIHPGDGVAGVERVDHGAHCRQGLVQVESGQGRAEQMVVPLLFIQRLDGSLPQLLTLFVQCTGKTGSQNGRNLIKLKAKSLHFGKTELQNVRNLRSLKAKSFHFGKTGSQNGRNLKKLKAKSLHFGKTGLQNGWNLKKLKAKSFSFWKDRITKC